MKVIILAAGRGTRLGRLGQNTPKALIQIGGQAVLSRTLTALPLSIKEIIIVTGHLEEKIKENFGNKFGEVPIKYANQGKMAGTAGALWSAKFLIKKEKFLVLNSDDIYGRGDLEQCLKYPLAMGLCKGMPANSKVLAIDIDQNNNLIGWHRPAEPEKNKGIWIATGCYILDSQIFDLEPVCLSSGEYGLPQTLFKIIGKNKINGVEMKSWFPVNTFGDIEAAEKKFN